VYARARERERERERGKRNERGKRREEGGEGTNENVGRELRIAGIPVPNRGLYIILAPYQVRITPRRCAPVVPYGAIIPCREARVLLEIETSALVRRRYGVPRDHFAGRAKAASAMCFCTHSDHCDLIIPVHRAQVMHAA